MSKPKISPIFVLETSHETKNNYGDYEIFASMEQVEDSVNERDSLEGTRAWEIDLNALPAKVVRRSRVVLE